MFVDAFIIIMCVCVYVYFSREKDERILTFIEQSKS